MYITLSPVSQQLFDEVLDKLRDKSGERRVCISRSFNIGFNTGLTEAQMRSLISVLESRVGKKEADNANEILSKVLRPI